MTRRLSLPLPLLVLALVAALTLGSFGTANAAGLTAKSVKKIAAKVVDKKASGLSVSHAATADSATTATTATTAASAANSAQLGGAAPATYLGRIVSSNFTNNVAFNGGSAQQIMNPIGITVPSGVGFIHVTAVASFFGGNTNVAAWASLDSPCVTAGEGYDHRSLSFTDNQTSIAVDYTDNVGPGAHTVRLCAISGVDSNTSFRSMSVQTVADGANG
jgi:hypothetical protein